MRMLLLVSAMLAFTAACSGAEAEVDGIPL